MTAAPESAGPVIAYLESALGLSFRGPRRTRLIASVEALRVACGLSPEAFLAAASRPGKVHDRLVAEVTVGETFFFRDRAQMALLREVVLPRLAAHPGRLALWSAGCAGGEEAYTLAALADEAGLLERCLVVGSDASRRAIVRAEQASYSAWSMRSTSAAERAAHFDDHGGMLHVADRLQQRTRFVQRNLLDGPPPPGRFDLVLCRNVLIYLTPAAVARTAEILAEALAPDGWLLTAAGDPPLAVAGLVAVRTTHGLAYRRSAAPAVAVDLPSTAPRATVKAAAPARPRAAARQHAGPRPVGAAPAARRSAESLAAHVRALGGTGDLDRACLAATEAVQAHPMDVELRYLAGVVLLEARRYDEAAEAASSAVYLGPDLPAAHLLLGQAEHARGNLERARRSFRNGARLLAAAEADAPVLLTGDLPAAHLASIAARYLSAESAR